MVRGETRTLGREGERIAFRYLRERGLRPVCRNFRCRHGEIDLVMRDQDCLVFVEVRLRSARRLVPAALTVDACKQRKLIRTAEWFLARHHAESCRARFDVVGLDRDAEGRLSISWLRDAFQP